MTFQDIEALAQLARLLQGTRDLGEKQELLLSYGNVASTLSESHLKPFYPPESDLSSKIALYSMIAIGQHAILFSHPYKEPPKEKVRTLLSQLVAIDRFYETIGGIVGYHVAVLQLLRSEQPRRPEKRFSVPPHMIDLHQTNAQTEELVMTGLLALPGLAEIYPLGGLGSRLGLKTKTHQPLPAAALPFAGRTLLEGLVRDIQAREFLYFRLFGRQITVPVAIMTSLEKQNRAHVEAICEKRSWFGRPKESFFLFSQLSVPVVTCEGYWSMSSPLEMNVQPGGHGALWKAAEETGVFLWLQKLEKSALLIRQINNPLAGMDAGLLALVGSGQREKKAFGFASCPRLSHAAEGVLALVEEEGKTSVSNIEYTEFARMGMASLIEKSGDQTYPANTNILYADLSQILPVIKKNPLPGLTLNMKTKEPYFTASGEKTERMGGRLESMMQNLSDALVAPDAASLPTFLTYNARRRTISAAKRSFDPHAPHSERALLETPEGAFYDLMYNNYELLRDGCSATLPPFSSQEAYLKRGPSPLILYHPALGPLYSVIAQKLRQLTFHKESELQLEIADLFIEDLTLEGSLLITATHTLGHLSRGIIRYSHQTGKCVLKKVRVKNQGIQRRLKQSYWKNQMKRHEAVEILIQGDGEFYAEGVTFSGGEKIVVPPGERWVARQKSDGSLSYTIERPRIRFEYVRERDKIRLVVAL